jgi:hypothetical protein
MVRIDSLFEGCLNLEYINIQNVKETNKIEKINDVFQNTPENLVICLNEGNCPKLTNLIKEKSCYTIYCGDDWIKHQKKLINGYPFIIKDIQYSKRFIFRFQFINLLSGLITGIASIDPGMMIISFLIRQNINLLIITSSVSLYGLTTSFFAFFYSFFSKECNFNYMLIISCKKKCKLLKNYLKQFGELLYLSFDK